MCLGGPAVLAVAIRWTQTDRITCLDERDAIVEALSGRPYRELRRAVLEAADTTTRFVHGSWAGNGDLHTVTREEW